MNEELNSLSSNKREMGTNGFTYYFSTETRTQHYGLQEDFETRYDDTIKVLRSICRNRV